MSRFEYSSSIRGYHIYKKHWTPYIGQYLTTTLEPGNKVDKFCVAVCNDNLTVGHIPKEISKIVHFFIKHGGTVTAIITDCKHYYSYEAGGLEIYCFLRFMGNHMLIERLRSILM